MEQVKGEVFKIFNGREQKHGVKVR